jgi:spermidine/putrescine transport system permease protein
LLHRGEHERMASWNTLKVTLSRYALVSRVLELGPPGSKYLHLAWLSAFYLVPLGLLAAISFWTISDYQLTVAFTLDNYRDVLGKKRYLTAAGASLKLGFEAAGLAVGLAVPAAHVLAFRLRGRVRQLILFVLLLPFFSSYIVRMFAWQSILNDNGILAWVLRKNGGTGAFGLLFTETAVLLGLLSVLIPIATLLIFLSLARLDVTLLAAARNLGASPWQTFLRLQLPFAMPGIVISFLFCFLLAFGDFVCAGILGGNKTYYLSTAIEDRVKINDWPTAAALGTLLLGTSLAVVALLFGLLNRLPTTGPVPRRARP